MSPAPPIQRDVIILGGGAAGLMCALTAGRRGRSVLLIEHAERLGKKILISGGGRCNFTNRSATAENYVTTGSPHFCKSALARFTPADFLALVEQHNIAHHERKHGQLFCDLTSRSIVEMLQTECAAARVEVRLNCRVEQVERLSPDELAGQPPRPTTVGRDALPRVLDLSGAQRAGNEPEPPPHPSRFCVTTNQGTFECAALVVATGGLSFPKLGATPFGHQLAEQFGLQLTGTRPGLVPLTWLAEDSAAFAELSGLAFEVEISHGGVTFRENLLFTHRGISGPSVLQISNYCPEGDALTINLLPGRSALDLLLAQRQSTKELKTVLSEFLPARFAQAWCQRGAPSQPMNRYTPKQLAAIAERLARWEIRPAGTEGYAKAEVTLGGVDTSELSSKTMAARRVPGLHFIGEVVDVTGWLGGYNFQWAWASGFAAGQAV